MNEIIAEEVFPPLKSFPSSLYWFVLKVCLQFMSFFNVKFAFFQLNCQESQECALGKSCPLLSIMIDAGGV